MLKQSVRKQEIIARLAVSRGQLREHRRRLDNALNLRSRVFASVKKSPKKWAIGSGVLGLVSSRLLFKKKKKKKELSAPTPAKEQFSIYLLKALVGLLLASLRPVLKEWLTLVAKSRLTQRARSRPTSL